MLQGNESRRADEGAGSERDPLDMLLLDCLPELSYLFDHEGRMLRWNLRTEQRTGYGGEEIAAMSPEAFFPDNERSRIAQAIRTAFAEGTAQVEGHLCTRDGRLIPHLFIASRIESGQGPLLAGFGIDIAERKATEEALRRSEAHYRALVEQSITGIYTIEAGRFTYVNRRFAEMFGYAEAEIAGRLGPEDLLGPEERPRVREFLRQRMAGERHTAH